MSIHAFVKNTLIERDGVHFVEGHKKFAYNDGDRAEQYVFDVIRTATDISSDSRELESHIRDWPSLYHLSRERSLAYRSLNIPPSATVLEVGCGCGSITRLLGERAAAVLALEGSPRRAAITRSRTRDLSSVHVLCASFEDVVFDSTFDLVVCNGVLEYASFFVKDENPHRRMVELLARLVKPGGSFIVAIENKLGLRYFSSGREEHTDVMFDGIEGYPRQPKGARTFGVQELRELLHSAFASVETCIPLPDYKLPTALIRAELLNKVNCAELFANTARYDFGSVCKPLMHERLVWHELQKNGQLETFVNSLLMVAGDRKTSLLREDWLGDIYSVRRRPEFAVRTRLTSSRDGGVHAVKSALLPDRTSAANSLVQHSGAASRWVDGVSVHSYVVRNLMTRGATPVRERIRDPVELWWSHLKRAYWSEGGFAGRVIDCNWQNSIVAGGAVVAIDEEWSLKGPVDPVWIIYRVVTKFLEDESPFFDRWADSVRGITAGQLIRAVAQIVEIPVSPAAIRRAIAREAELQAVVRGAVGGLYASKSLVRLYEPLTVRARRRVAGRLMHRAAQRLLRR